jgi:3-hydroxybutyrate dehydrogenase
VVAKGRAAPERKRPFDKETRTFMFLKGKTALVTGSTSGIGLACARALAAEGANVVLNGFGDPAEIEKMRGEVEAASGGRAIHSGADLTRADEIERMMKEAEDAIGSIDILINNAGMQHVAPADQFPVDKWDLIIALNLSAVFHTTRLALPAMKAKGWGRIINTASAHSLVASPNKAPYVASKHGVAGFTKSVALENATSGVTANCISPGYVWTPLVENQIPDTMKARGLSREQVMNDVLLAAQPSKKFVTVDQVAAFALFLCRDEASAITGANLSMDGGWTAQ